MLIFTLRGISSLFLLFQFFVVVVAAVVTYNSDSFVFIFAYRYKEISIIVFFMIFCFFGSRKQMSKSQYFNGVYYCLDSMNLFHSLYMHGSMYNVYETR